MKRRASLLIEIMVAILIFTTGLIGLAGSIMLALKMVAQSEATTVAEQSAINQYERYMAKRLSQKRAHRQSRATTAAYSSPPLQSL